MNSGPLTEKVSVGEELPIPTRLFCESTKSVPLSKSEFPVIEILAPEIFPEKVPDVPEKLEFVIVEPLIFVTEEFIALDALSIVASFCLVCRDLNAVKSALSVLSSFWIFL